MRIKIIKAEEVDPSLKELVPEIVGLRGSFLNLHGALANSPKALKAFMVFSRYVRDDSELDPQLRELAILLIGHRHENPYEIAHHRPAARKVGLSDEKIMAVSDWRTAEVFEPRELAVLSYIEEAVNGFRVTDQTFAELKKYLSDEQIVDLSLVLGWYQLCSSVLLPLQVPIDQEFLEFL